nr:hypothetical protein [Crateriforma conspicua]
MAALPKRVATNASTPQSARGVREAESCQRSNRPVVFAGHGEEFLFDRLPVAALVANSQFAEPFIAKVALVPTLCPTQPVEEPVQFRFPFAGTRSVPAALRPGLLGVIPTRASFAIQGEFNQAKYKLKVAGDLLFVQAAGKRPDLDAVSAAGEVRQVQQVVAV